MQKKTTLLDSFLRSYFVVVLLVSDIAVSANSITHSIDTPKTKLFSTYYHKPAV